MQKQVFERTITGWLEQVVAVNPSTRFDVFFHLYISAVREEQRHYSAPSLRSLVVACKLRVLSSKQSQNLMAL